MAENVIEEEAVVNAGRTTTVDIRVRQAVAIVGTVENVSTESLLKGVKVRLFDANGKPVSELLTGDDGGFRFGNLSPGSFEVRISLPKGYIVDGDTERWVDVGQGEVRCDFKVHRHGAVEGRVSTEDGQPLQGVEVVLVDSSGSVVRSGRTNTEGRYSFPDVPVDKYRVRVTAAA